MCKTAAMALFVAMAGVSAAQGLATKLDIKTGEFSPAVTLPVFEFDSVLGFKAKSRIIAFAGSSLSDGLLSGGGAWVIDFPLAKSASMTLRGFVGPSLDFSQNRPTGLGVVFGVQWGG